MTDGNLAVKSQLRNKEVKSQECTVHRSRGVGRQVYKIMPQLFDVCTDSPYKKKMLADACQQRAQKELTMARKKNPHNDQKFFDQIEAARKCILLCMSGDHSKCRLGSCVCKGKRKGVTQLHGQRQFPLSEIGRAHV